MSDGTFIGSVADRDRDLVETYVDGGVVSVLFVGVYVALFDPAAARALAAILNSAADVAEGQGR